MTKPRNRLFCRLDGLTPIIREQKRLKIIDRLGLLSSELVPVFEEATQTASAFLETSICILSLAMEDELRFKSAVGLSTVGLMNQLASQRKIAFGESFSIYVVDSQQPLVIEDTLTESVFAKSLLAQYYGIRAYLGVPLISSEGICIGTLEVMDLRPREFSQKEVDFLALTARWCLREFERNQAIAWQQESTLSLSANSRSGSSQQVKSLAVTASDETSSVAPADLTTHPIKVKLLAQLTQELRTPLTSVIGMASVLCREVYGSLTLKQREYLEIIHDSGQNLISIVDEIVSLGVLSEDLKINAASIDIEMLCQQVINSLNDKAKQHQQSLRLSVEPGNRIWHLDKEKVRQALYYLINGVLEISESGGEVRIHVSRRDRTLNVAVWISHPWLGTGFTPVELYSQSVSKALAINEADPEHSFDSGKSDVLLGNKLLTASALMKAIAEGEKPTQDSSEKIPRDVLGLLLCCHLIELHEGQVIVQGSLESGYRYVLQFPKARLEEEQI